jgi:hypothetical protein
MIISFRQALIPVQTIVEWLHFQQRSILVAHVRSGRLIHFENNELNINEEVCDTVKIITYFTIFLWEKMQPFRQMIKAQSVMLLNAECSRDIVFLW